MTKETKTLPEVVLPLTDIWGQAQLWTEMKENTRQVLYVWTSVTSVKYVPTCPTTSIAKKLMFAPIKCLHFNDLPHCSKQTNKQTHTHKRRLSLEGRRVIQQIFHPLKTMLHKHLYMLLPSTGTLSWYSIGSCFSKVSCT